MSEVPQAVRMFAPEQWGEVARFRTLSPTTYEFRPYELRTLAGVENHFRKAQTLLALAEELLSGLDHDEAELEAQGYTTAQNAKTLAALLEGVITEIYSVVDCTAKVLHAVYGRTSTHFRNSTRRRFAEVNSIRGSFPERIKDWIRSAVWYEELRQIRDELTHRDVGSCSRDRETGLVRYFHSSLWEGERLNPIDDIFGWIKANIEAANAFIGVAFHELNSTIISGTVTHPCGIVQGRILMRLLDASQPIDFHNGTCLSAHWFTVPGNPGCPFVDMCGAFQRRATPEQLKEVFGKT